MDQIKKENNFIWLTAAMVGLLITGAFSRDFPDSLTIVMLELLGVGLLFMSLFFGAAGFGTLCDILDIDFEITARDASLTRLRLL